MITQKRIHWDEAEKTLVVSEVKRKMAAGDKLTLAVFNEAIRAVLPPDRVRNIVSFSNATWLGSMISNTPHHTLVVKQPTSEEPLVDNIMEHQIDGMKKFGMTPFVISRLQAHGINTIGDLLINGSGVIDSIKGLGPKASTSIRVALSRKEKGSDYNLVGMWKGTHLISSTLPESPKEEVNTISEMDTLAETLVKVMTPYLQSLAGQVVTNSIAVFEKEIKAALQTRIPQQASAKSTYKVDEARVAKKKVVVVGMQNKEAARLEKEFSGQFSLRVYNSTKSLETLRNILPSADHVLVSATNCSHNATDVVNSRYLGAPIMVNGGLTQMRKELAKLAA